jgi:hypothetical protein
MDGFHRVRTWHHFTPFGAAFGGKKAGFGDIFLKRVNQPFSFILYGVMALKSAVCRWRKKGILLPTTN